MEPKRVGSGDGNAEALGAAVAGGGAATTAALAAACCVGPTLGPLIVGVLGVGGAIWLASLQPYSPVLLAASFLVLAYGFWSVYRPRPASAGACTPGRGRRVLGRISIGLLWFAAVLWLAAATSYFLLT